MTGYEAYGLYESLKLHFSKDSYDFFKYNGKTNISLNTFDNRKDKYHFHKLSRKFSDKDVLINFLVANFILDDVITLSPNSVSAELAAELDPLAKAQ